MPGVLVHRRRTAQPPGGSHARPAVPTARGVGAVAGGALALVSLARWLGLAPVTLYSLTARLDASLGAPGVVRALGTVVSAAAVVAVAWRWRTGDRAGAVGAVALMTSVAVLLGLVVQPWYLLWAVPFVAVLPLGARLGRVGSTRPVTSPSAIDPRRPRRRVARRVTSSPSARTPTLSPHPISRRDPAGRPRGR